MAASDPRIDKPDFADSNSFCLRSERNDFADRLVAHGERQRHAAIFQRQRLSAVAEIVAALPDVQVAVTDAGGFDFKQHLRSGRLRRYALHHTLS